MRYALNDIQFISKESSDELVLYLCFVFVNMNLDLDNQFNLPRLDRQPLPVYTMDIITQRISQSESKEVLMWI